jgi:hypothetical protein
MFFCEKPGPNWTIAKGIAERKEKPQKRLEKCGFFWRGVEITAKTAGYERFERGCGGATGGIGAPSPFEKC